MAVRMAARRLRTAGTYLVFDVCAACGARAAAYEALFVQRRAAAKALFFAIRTSLVPVFLRGDVCQSSQLRVAVREACLGLAL